MAFFPATSCLLPLMVDCCSRGQQAAVPRMWGQVLHTHPVFHSYPGSRFIDIQVAVPRMWSQVLYTGHHVFHGYELNWCVCLLSSLCCFSVGNQKTAGSSWIVSPFVLCRTFAYWMARSTWVSWCKKGPKYLVASVASFRLKGQPFGWWRVKYLGTLVDLMTKARKCYSQHFDDKSAYHFWEWMISFWVKVH